MSFSHWKIAVALSAGLALFALPGCGPGGPRRYDLSGTVTFQGQPVPAGNIRFEPAEGNAGPGTSADIQNGKFKTAVGEGHIGGPHKVFINGADGVAFEMGGGKMNPLGKPIFTEFSTSVDLPKQNGEQSFAVPEQ